MIVSDSHEAVVGALTVRRALPQRQRRTIGAWCFVDHMGPVPVAADRGEATVLVGEFAGGASPARRDTDHVGIDLTLHVGRTVVPLQPHHEDGLVVFAGSLLVDDVPIVPGHLGYLGSGRDECALDAMGEVRALLIGGLPFGEPPLMWWNFVARTRSEIDDAYRAWSGGDGRFGSVDSRLARIPAAPPLWWPVPRT